jgi:sigma-54 dependent transcriptional regulator, acetoin dehydrogenase operon transcriptional activator AcoR
MTSGAEQPLGGQRPDDGRRDEFSDLGLREDIQLSWLRSRMALAPMDRLDVPFDDVDDDGRRLLRGVGPLLARFAENLSDTRFTLVLADRNGRVVGTFAGGNDMRRHLAALSIEEGFVLTESSAGTNGIGTVLEERRPMLVIGEEHYAESLRHLICAGTPLLNPITGRLEGVLDLACPREEWSKLITPALAQLRHDVEHEMAARAPLTQRLIFEQFTARCRETSAALVGVSDQYMITNAAATDLLSPADQGVIWSAISRADEAGGVHSITLSNGRTIEAKSQVIRLGGSVGGHLVELAPRSLSEQPRPRRRTPATTVESLLNGVVRAAPQRLLILGEPGSGKMTAARQIHHRLNGEQPITVLSCELSLVAAGHSWLDELAIQLRRTEETTVLRHIDVLTTPVAQAVVALLDRRATGSPPTGNTDPGAAAKHPGPRVIATASDPLTDGWSGALREALSEQTAQLPPLRERRSEFAALAAAMLNDIAPGVHLSGRALAALQNYGWPGNFTQLRSVLTHSAKAASRNVIGPEHLPGEVAGTLRGPQALSRIEELEREAIIAVLREHQGNKLRAAEALGMSRSTFYRRLRQLRLDSSALLT